MTNDERQAELLDCEASIAFHRRGIDKAAVTLVSQLERSGQVYGQNRNTWPASSEMLIRELESEVCEAARAYGAALACRDDLQRG